MVKETKKQSEVIYYKRRFTLAVLLIIFLSFGLFIATTSYIESEKRIEIERSSCLELNKISFTAVESCVKYYNITNDEFQQIYKDYLIKKYMNQSDTKEVENE